MGLIGKAEVVVTELERWENEGGSYRCAKVSADSIGQPAGTNVFNDDRQTTLACGLQGKKKLRDTKRPR